MNSEAENGSSDFFTADETKDDVTDAKSAGMAAIGTRKEPSKPQKEPAKRRRALLDDDFFVLDHSFSKKGRRKDEKRRSRKKQGSSEVLSGGGEKGGHEKKSTEGDLSKVLKEFREPIEVIIPKDIEAANMEADTTIEGTNNRMTRSRRQSTKKRTGADSADFSVITVNDDSFSIPSLSSDSEDDNLASHMNRQGSVSKREKREYDFNDDEEEKRIYILKIYDRLGTTAQSRPILEHRVKGTDRFGAIVPDILAEVYSGDKLYYMRQIFNSMDNVALIWIEGRREIKAFFKPSTLRIPPPIDIAGESTYKTETVCNCMLIPRDDVGCFLTKYEEFKTESFDYGEASSNTLREKYTPSDDSESDVIALISDDEERVRENSIDAQNINIGGTFFSIGLKGKDNKRIDVEVSSDTQIRNLLSFYVKKKEMDIGQVDLSKAKLIFDDEELNMNSKIKDTELEEDFEIQVVL